jgi:hypothetical protein
MRHVFVETNWVYAYAAPAHHKRLDAVDLLERARRGEVRLHLPGPCLTEARQPIRIKCQPRHEADAIRRFLLRARAEQRVSPEEERVTREVLDRFEDQVRRELRQLDETIIALRQEPNLEVFPLNDGMLAKAVDLAQLDLVLKPFDQAILAAVLVRAGELMAEGETDLCFCESDADLQPWDKHGEARQPLTGLYAAAGVWVYENFAMDTPGRSDGWPPAVPS